jgi:hypothetical protein
MSNQLQQDIKQALAYRSSSTHKTLMEIPHVLDDHDGRAKQKKEKKGTATLF